MNELIDNACWPLNTSLKRLLVRRSGYLEKFVISPPSEAGNPEFRQVVFPLTESVYAPAASPAQETQAPAPCQRTADPGAFSAVE